MSGRNDLEPVVRDWLHHTLDQVPDPTHRFRLVAAEVEETKQQRAWLPVPMPAQDTLWSTGKSIVAISIVLLVGGFLVAAALLGGEVEDERPATVTVSPILPTGTFAADDGIQLELHPDGSCVRAGVPCTYGVNGALFSEMSSESPAGPRVPATYRWRYEDERLTFELWGMDLQPERQAVYEDRVFRPVGETSPLPDLDSGFPIGRFVAIDDDGTTLSFREDGRWRAGSPRGGAAGAYVTVGNLYTEMTHNSDTTAQVPATYQWRWDGERLTFIPTAVDADTWRKSFYVDHVYTRPAVAEGPMRRLLLSDPRLEVWVAVEIWQDDETFKAVATVDEKPFGEGVGTTQQDAVRAALEPLGEPYASDIADNVEG